MKKSIFRAKYAVKEEKEIPVVEVKVEDVPENVENENSSILEIGKVKISRRKKGDE